jgi:hypothetical protein
MTGYIKVRTHAKDISGHPTAPSKRQLTTDDRQIAIHPSGYIRVPLDDKDISLHRTVFCHRQVTIQDTQVTVKDLSRLQAHVFTYKNLSPIIIENWLSGENGRGRPQQE